MKTINFAEQFVPLIESGRKTQTRRLIKPQPHECHNGDLIWKDRLIGSSIPERDWSRLVYPEAWLVSPFGHSEIYKVNGTALKIKITDIWIERVRDISQEDAISEGAPKSHSSIDFVSRYFGFKDFSRSWFGQKWESIYPGSWSRNDWVWACEFKKV